MKALAWRKLKKGLENNGILTSTGKKGGIPVQFERYSETRSIMGDALLQKTYTVDFLTKKIVQNNGVVPQYYVENSHEAIITKEIFMQVQEDLIRRSTGHVGTSGKKRNFICSHPFS